MLVSDVRELIAKGEGAKIEFKRDDVRAENLAKELVSFANMNGGVVLLGVEDDGDISGTSRKDLQAWLMDTVIRRYIAPQILPDYEEVSIEGKVVAVVTVHQGMSKPYVVKQNDREDIYLRMGNTCQPATREQMGRLYDLGGLLATDKLPVYGASFADLDKRRCADYFDNINRTDNSSQEEPGSDDTRLIDWLMHRDLMRPLPASNDAVCTIGGLVLFGKHPARRLPQASIRLTVYPGADKSVDSLLDEDLSTPFVGLRSSDGTSDVEPSIPSRVMEYLRPHISRERVEGMHRKRQWDYPEAAIRELVVNAFAHRDWTRNTDIEIGIYNNRMEVISPGALPNGMTIEKLKAGQRVPRNNNIINVLRDYGLMEHQGMGIRLTVIPSMLKHNKVEPEFEATEDLFKVTLKKKPEN